MRTTDTLSSSPSHEASLLYAQFISQGMPDVPGTLLVIAKRFEKLGKSTVGHVRALEDRMNDVEGWLVDKEAEKEKEKEKHKESESESLRHASSADNMKNEIHYLRDEVVKLQGRLGELGREMVNIATAPNNLSAGPKTHSVAVSTSVAPENLFLHRHTLASGFFHCNALDRIAVRTQHTHPPSQVIKYHCEKIYESSDDFEEKRVGHEVTLPYRRLCFSA